MPNTYSQLCPVMFGAGTAGALADKVKEFGGGPVLCIYDGGIKASGVADGIVKRLRDAGIDTDVFDEVDADAPDTIINRAGEIVRAKKYGVLVGIGGGSSLDSAKAIALLAEHPGPIADHYLTWQNGKDVKLILIPTTSGTGSEVTPMSVIHDTARNIKASICRPADFSIVDPELTLTVPPRVTAFTGMDALSHAVESYTSAPGYTTPHSDLLALEAVRLIAGNIETAVSDGRDLAARTAMAFASNIAGISFAESCVHAGHAIAHELGVQIEQPHGLICALVTPIVIEYCAPCMPERMVALAEALGVEGAVPETAGKLAADAVRALNARLGLPKLRELCGDREKVVACAQGAVDHNIFIVAAPRPTGVPEIAELLGKMWDD